MRKNGFLAGVCTTLLVLALGTSALAASGKVSFNFANVSLNGETKITAGSNITVANGEKGPRLDPLYRRQGRQDQLPAHPGHQ